MWLKSYLVFAQYIIFYIKYEFTSAMVGQNVRLAREGEFDFVVSIKKINNENSDPEKDFLCTGTLISKIDILTVEHCFKFCPPNHSEVIVASTDLRRGRKFYPSKMITYFTWAIQKKLRLSQHHDIAVVKLSEAVPNNIKPAALSTLTHPFISGLDVVISGWGENATGILSMVMETAALKVLSNIDCIKQLNKLQVKINTLHIKFMCTVADPYAVMCAGNSGSPVLHNGDLIAIHEGTCPFPDERFHPDQINLNLSIDFFRNFILDVINSS